eukprot:scpid81457/ scgid21980/ Alpha-galactosidase; Alpha-D-galactoside galactohydrolase; Melibiase
MSASLVSVLLLVTSGVFSGVLALDNGLGLTPQMGWNSWNHFHCGINEQLIKDTADRMVSTGLLAAGYEYLNLDDCWARTRDEKNVVHPDPKDFPSGMKALGDYIHSKGLKYGIYSDSGSKTCAGRPGSLGFEEIDAKTYAEWGVDYLKFDNCNSGKEKPETRYPVMRDALNKTGRPIFFSMCEWGVDNPATWAPEVGNSWRTTGDINDSWKSMISRADLNEPLYSYAGPGAWNDPDMLEVGNGGMSNDEDMTHFSLWALMKAPLLVGCDITKLSNNASFILTNKEVIAVSQDKLGKQGQRVKQDTLTQTEIWSVDMADKSKVVILLNRHDSETQAITVDFHEDLGWPAATKATPRDLWLQKDLAAATGSYKSGGLNPHAINMVRFSPQ